MSIRFESAVESPVLHGMSNHRRKVIACKHGVRCSPYQWTITPIRPPGLDVTVSKGT